MRCNSRDNKKKIMIMQCGAKANQTPIFIATLKIDCKFHASISPKTPMSKP